MEKPENEIEKEDTGEVNLKKSEENSNTPSTDTHSKEEGNETMRNSAGTADELLLLKNALATKEKDLLYYRAEFDNYKKRMQREQDRAIQFSNEKFIRELLFVVDLFERALSAAESLKEKTDKEIKTFLDGVAMTHRELTQMLNRFGVEFKGTEGEPFDPAHHEAISQQEAPPEKVNTVLQVLQKGCSLHGRLLTPAKVVVGKTETQKKTNN